MRVTSLAVLLPSVAGIAMAAPTSNPNTDVDIDSSEDTMQWMAMCTDFATKLGPKVQVVLNYYAPVMNFHVNDPKNSWGCNLHDGQFNLEVDATDVIYLKFRQAQAMPNDGMQKM